MLKVIPYFILIFSFIAGDFAQARDIIYPGKDRDIYINLLLKHALSYAENTEYNIKGYGKHMPRGREYKLLAKAGIIDVIADGATRDRESKYLPIRFPILKGLNGWRIPLIHKDNKNKFLKPIPEEKFKELIAVQFHSWSDSEILERNGIHLYKGGDKQGLYRMLHRKRVDYFPRSVLEINKEYKTVKHLDIMIDQHIAIHYPSAFYFYVNKGDIKLARDIEDGLEKALIDGSLDALFMQFFSDAIDMVLSQNRRVIKLHNPLLTDLTPLNRKELWINTNNEVR